MNLEQYRPIDKAAINHLLDEIEKDACGCDMMLGYSCGIHKNIRLLRELVENPIKVSKN